MKKLILIASLLISGSLWAETLNLCYMYTTQELYGFGFMQKNIDKCNDGDVLQFYFKDSSGATNTVAKYCNQDKQITLLEDTNGVCTLKLYSEIKRVSPEGPEAKKLREDMENDETLQKFLKVIKKGEAPSTIDVSRGRSTIEDVEDLLEEIRLREKPDQ